MKRVLLVNPIVNIARLHYGDGYGVNYVNIALGKISSYHKLLGDEVVYLEPGKEIYNQDKSTFDVDASEYDRVYVSQVFSYIKARILNCDDVIFGGSSSINPNLKLSGDIESSPIDYSIFDSSWDNHAIGFITKGCIRKCVFCDVPKVEGKLYINDTIENIVQNRDVLFSDLNEPFGLILFDNNILAHRNCMDYLSEIRDKKYLLSLPAAYDIRLITDEKAKILSEINHEGQPDFITLGKTDINKCKNPYYDNPKYRFSFDDLSYADQIEKGFEILRKYIPEYEIQMYLYFDERSYTFKDLLQRIDWCYERNCKPKVLTSVRLQHQKIKLLSKENKIISIGSHVSYFDDIFGEYNDILFNYNYSLFSSILSFISYYAGDQTWYLIKRNKFKWDSSGIVRWAREVNYPDHLFLLKEMGLL